MQSLLKSCDRGGFNPIHLVLDIILATSQLSVVKPVPAYLVSRRRIFHAGREQRRKRVVKAGDDS